MDLQARIELWKSIDPDPAFCRKAERDMLLLSSSDENWVSERMRDFDRALDEKITEHTATISRRRGSTPVAHRASQAPLHDA